MLLAVYNVFQPGVHLSIGICKMNPEFEELNDDGLSSSPHYPQSNDVSWKFCDEEGSAGEALVITVEDGKCTSVGGVVPVVPAPAPSPAFVNPPGTGDDVMCDTCVEYSSQVNTLSNQSNNYGDIIQPIK